VKLLLVVVLPIALLGWVVSSAFTAWQRRARPQ
jgi:hypothetical protein